MPTADCGWCGAGRCRPPVGASGWSTHGAASSAPSRVGGRPSCRLTTTSWAPELAWLGRRALFYVERCSHELLVVGLCCGHAARLVWWGSGSMLFVMLSFLWSTHDNGISTSPPCVGLHCIVFQPVDVMIKHSWTVWGNGTVVPTGHFLTFLAAARERRQNYSHPC